MKILDAVAIRYINSDKVKALRDLRQVFAYLISEDRLYDVERILIELAQAQPGYPLPFFMTALRSTLNHAELLVNRKRVFLTLRNQLVTMCQDEDRVDDLISNLQGAPYELSE